MPFTKKDALREFIAWTKTHGANWPLGEVTVNGSFSHFFDGDTDAAWMGFHAGWRILAERSAASDMVSVPREPTQSMVEAGYAKSSGSGNVRGVYAAMLDVAPPSPVDLIDRAHLATLADLVALVAADTLGPSTADDPDDDAVGWKGDGAPLPMTFGHVRRAQAAIAALMGQSDAA